MIVAIPTNNLKADSEVPLRAQNSAYCEYVLEEGMTPVLVPMEADPEIIADMADVLLLAGGIDIDPIYYGRSNTASFCVDPEKDQAERNLMYSFIKRKKNVFGICRGMQLIFREFLFELESINSNKIRYFDYLENVAGHSQTSGLETKRRFPSHFIKADMKKLYSQPDTGEGFTMTPVNSMHHQACLFNHGLLLKDNISAKKKLMLLKGNNVEEPSVTKVHTKAGLFELLGYSLRSVNMPKNKNELAGYYSIIEAFRLTTMNGSKLLAVQWHPEEMRNRGLLSSFFNSFKAEHQV